MKYISYKRMVFFLLPVLFLVGSCAKVETREPINAKPGKPGQVSNVTVSNFKGGATITYALPAQGTAVGSPLYIMAEYEINKITHKTRQAKASIYENKMVVDGFNTEGDYTVKLYSVSASEEKSDPIVVTVKPEKPPFRDVFDSLNLLRDFGGTSTAFTNETKSNVAISIITRNKNNELYPTETLYTSAEEGNVVARGFDTLSRDFGIYVRDKFDNYSDTLWVKLKPIYEKQLDKSKFREFSLPGDNVSDYGWVVSNLWDNNLGSGYHSVEGIPLPIRITFDLGVVTKLSRFKIWQRDGYLFQWGNPRFWTMWGSTSPDRFGSYEGWVKLMDCESTKPSKSPMGTNTPDDIAYAKAGEEYIFPSGGPDVRYIRFECHQNWSNSGRLHMMELTFWGGN